jgi:hypothetical protein
MKLVVSCGLGVDSTALIVLLKQQERFPDLIIFADTGGEKPETYHYKKIFERWLVDNGFPPLVTVRHSRRRKGVTVNSLEEECLAGQRLPGIAYGKKNCSISWKKEPAERYVKKWANGCSVSWLLAFNADELRRAIPRPGCQYPLIEAGWGRKRCLTEIHKAGLPLPAKSACFFCPSSKKHEIKALARKYPDLANRAIKIEQSAKGSNTAIGLGRQFSWESVITQELQQEWLFTINACGCIEEGVSIESYWNQFF